MTDVHLEPPAAAAAADVPADRPLVTVEPVGAWVRYRAAVLGTVGVLILLVGWQLVSSLALIDPLYISSPIRIVEAAPVAITDDGFLHHIAVSAQEFVLGMLLVILTGIPFGMLAGWYRPVRELSDPVVSALFATPIVALVPILVLTLGIGVGSKVAFVYLLAVWPVVINTTAGIRDIDPGVIRMARTFGAGDWRIFHTIALPASVPHIIVGLRNAVSRGIIAVVVGELYGASAGIGYYLNQTGQIFQTDRYYFAVVFLALVGVLLGLLLTALESRVSGWKVDR
ncbi:ABC transporter permease [Pseudonocardia sp. GCM10023141]|uniref:ABC transporter permease n=1 Tax=Pseudonocardia sp. GCM10023141 TaxID=3252653 RepID=UPI0036220F03